MCRFVSAGKQRDKRRMKQRTAARVVMHDGVEDVGKTIAMARRLLIEKRPSLMRRPGCGSRGRTQMQQAASRRLNHASLIPACASRPSRSPSSRHSQVRWMPGPWTVPPRPHIRATAPERFGCSRPRPRRPERGQRLETGWNHDRSWRDRHRATGTDGPVKTSLAAIFPNRFRASRLRRIGDGGDG